MQKEQSQLSALFKKQLLDAPKQKSKIMNIDIELELDSHVYKTLLALAAEKNVSLNLLIEKFLAELSSKKAIKYQCFENK